MSRRHKNEMRTTFSFSNKTANLNITSVLIVHTSLVSFSFTQLRLGRSFLASHGFAIGVNTSDLCLCWRSETTRHYFLECFLFQEER